MRKLILTACIGLLLAPCARALEIPLTITERAGLDRVGNHVNSGIPLPQGAYQDSSKFALYDANGKIMPAQFVVRERWLKDSSVRFMTVHFATDLKAGTTARFSVRDDRKDPASPNIKIKVTETDDAVTVDTGKLSFSVKKGDWHLFDTLKSGDASLKAPGKVIFKAEYGKTPVGGGIATPPTGLDVKPAKAVLKEIKVEEKGTQRVVLLIKGSFQEGGADKLDFQARYYVLAGSPAVRVAFTVINRQGKAWDQFVGIRSLGFELPFDLPGDRKFVLGTSEGKDLQGQLAAGEKVVLLQPNSLAGQVMGKQTATITCKKLSTNRVGWLSLAGKNTAVTTGVRWFWQLHPKGLAATGDGVLKVYLVPPQKKKVAVPAGQYTESITRIDLYTGGARTHEVLFTFHKPDADQARARALGVTQPLFAACSTAWYCQQTLAFGRICDAKLENFRPEVRDLVKKYEATVDANFWRVMIRYPGHANLGQKVISHVTIPDTSKDKSIKGVVWCSAQKIEEYGWMNFGSHIEHGTKVKPNDALNSHWDGNYYDFPRACLLRFVRTGWHHYLDEAQRSGYHLADIDIAHWNPSNPKQSGIEHVCPNMGHFRTFWPGKAFQPSGNVHSCKSQSLYELYSMTGDAWFRDAALLSGEYLLNHKGGNVRGMGNRITGLYSAYRATGDQRFKQAWIDDVVKRTAAGAIKTGGTRRWDQAWQYGLGCEAMHDYWMETGDLIAAKGIKFATDSLMNHPWGGSQRSQYDGLAGFTLAVSGYAYEVTGDASYLRYGVTRLEKTAKSYGGRSKTWAQMARISPQFLYYVSKFYKPPKPVIGDKQQADPVDAAFKASAPKPQSKQDDVGEM
jgi:PcRGLX-like protein central beta sandwich domain